MSRARVLLMTLSIRESAKGRPYLSGFLGRARVVAFHGQADRYGNENWDVFVDEPETASERRPPAQSQRGGRGGHESQTAAAPRAAVDALIEAHRP